MNEERRIQEVRLEGNGLDADAAIFGRAISHTTLSGDLGGWRERCAPGCADRAIRERDDVKVLFNHDQNQIIGSVRANNVKIESKSDGVYFTCSPLPATEAARSLRELVSKGIVRECSFGFRCDKNDVDWGEEIVDGVQTPVRTIRSITKLYDLSPVVSPAYDAPGATACSARSLSDIPSDTPVEFRSRISASRMSVASGPYTLERPPAVEGWHRMTPSQQLAALEAANYRAKFNDTVEGRILRARAVCASIGIRTTFPDTVAGRLARAREVADQLK